MMKKTNEKKSESTRITYQTRLTHQTWDLCHKSLIIKQKKFNIKKLN